MNDKVFIGSPTWDYRDAENMNHYKKQIIRLIERSKERKMGMKIINEIANETSDEIKFFVKHRRGAREFVIEFDIPTDKVADFRTLIANGDLNDFSVFDAHSIRMIRRWQQMSELEKNIYYYFFLWSLDQYITKQQVQFGEGLSRRYCQNGKCKTNYVKCCAECPLTKHPCSKHMKPRVCSIAFCPDISAKLTHKQRKILPFDAILNSTETIRMGANCRGFPQIRGHIIHPPKQ
jgi:hypothetical protein